MNFFSSRSRSRSSSCSRSSSSSSCSSSDSRSRSSSSSSKSSGYRRRRGGGGSGGGGGDSPRRQRKRSLSPKSSRLYIGRLTRNVNTDHLYEIFGNFGKVVSVDMPMDRVQHHLNRGFAYVEFENTEEAARAIKFMDGGQIDGHEVSVSKADYQKARGGPLPPRRGPPGSWRHNSPVRRRRSPPPPRRSPRRSRASPSRSRSPVRDRRRRSSGSSSNSSR